MRPQLHPDKRPIQTPPEKTVIGPLRPDPQHQQHQQQPQQQQHQQPHQQQQHTPLIPSSKTVIGPLRPDPQQQQQQHAPLIPSEKNVIGPQFRPDPQQQQQQQHAPLIPSERPVTGPQFRPDPQQHVPLIGPTLPSQLLSDHLHRDEDDSPEHRQTETEKKVRKGTRREEWMTVPPTKGSLNAFASSIKPRKFSKQGVTASKVSHLWTDTPDSKREQKGSDEQKGTKRKRPSPPPAPIVREKRRGEENSRPKKPSLLEQHQQKQAKKAKEMLEKDQQTEWRGWDREKDLQVRRVSGKDLNSYLQKAKQLNSGFESTHYL